MPLVFDQTVRHPVLTTLADAVGEARRSAARCGRCRRADTCEPVGRVDADALPGRVETRTIQPHAPGLAWKRRRVEVRGQAGFVVLRLHPVEAEAVVERQAVAHLPVVLRIPLDVPVAVVADRSRPTPAGKLLEHAGRRVGGGVAGVERVRVAVGEVDDAVVVAEAALVLQALLRVEADLRRVPAPHLGQVAEEVVGRVEVGERRVVRADVRLSCRSGRRAGTAAA